MKTLTLTPKQKNIKNLSGHVYVKINEHYTATVRNLQEFLDYLNNNNDYNTIEIVHYFNVCGGFLKAVMDIINKVNNTASQKNKIYKGVKVYNCDAPNKVFTIDLIVREDGKIKLLFDTFGGEWVQRFQTVKETSKGYYVTMYKSRIYFYSKLPKF